MTFNVCSASAITSPNHAHVASELKLSLRHNRHNRYPKIERGHVTHQLKFLASNVAKKMKNLQNLKVGNVT